MRSGSANVMDVTFDGFTPASHFSEPVQAFNLVDGRRCDASESPEFLKLYTKATGKANPRPVPRRVGEG
jgi:hypothetical protein